MLAPQNFAYALFSISLGTAVIPRRNENQRLRNFFWGGGGGGGKQGVLWDMSKWQILLCLVYQGVFGHFMPTIPIISEDFRRLPKMSEEPSKHLTEFSLETLSPTQTFKTQLTNLRNTKKQQEATPARTDCYSSESCLNK